MLYLYPRAEGGFMTGQSMISPTPPTSLLVLLYFMKYVILPEWLRSPIAVNLGSRQLRHTTYLWNMSLFQVTANFCQRDAIFM